METAFYMPLRWRHALLVLPTVRSWMSSAKTNDGLVTNFIRDGVVEKGGAVEKALRRLDRKNFAGAVAPAFGRGGGMTTARLMRMRRYPSGRARRSRRRTCTGGVSNCWRRRCSPRRNQGLGCWLGVGLPDGGLCSARAGRRGVRSG